MPRQDGGPRGAGSDDDRDSVSRDDGAGGIDPRLWFLRDMDAFAQRFVLAEILGEPPGRRRRPMGPRGGQR